MCNERLFYRKLSFLCSINGENRSHSYAENIFSILNYLTTIDWRWNVTFIKFTGGLFIVHCPLPIYESLCKKYQLDLNSNENWVPIFKCRSLLCDFLLNLWIATQIDLFFECSLHVACVYCFLILSWWTLLHKILVDIRRYSIKIVFRLLKL